MNVMMMDRICAECGRRLQSRRRSSSECVRTVEVRGVAGGAFEREYREDAQIEQIERNFGRNWKW